MLRRYKRSIVNFLMVAIFSIQSIYALPYWDPRKVPSESDYYTRPLTLNSLFHLTTHCADKETAVDVLRMQVDWQGSETYKLKLLTIEPSGTPALLARSKHKPRWGSYLGIIKSKNTGLPISYDSIGTGKEYRKLVRAISLRFPVPEEDSIFELYAENPNSGVMEIVLTQEITTEELKASKNTKPKPLSDLEVKELSLANTSPSLRINIYAEGYSKDEKPDFWQQAAYTVATLKAQHFPGIEHMSFYAVFSPSNKKLGSPRSLGLPVPEYDSFMGLFYVYWVKDTMERWYNGVYPTSETKFRLNLASAPYDYPLILVHTGEYIGIGNYNAFTALPALSNQFTYLLIHEMGHMFGLNEEYSGRIQGRTDLEFAPSIFEPWSQNITFLRDKQYRHLKWKRFVDVRTNLPTSYWKWQPSPPVYGAYEGGYANSPVTNARSHVPGLECVMDRYKHFCDICKHGITDVVNYSLGME